MGFNVSFRPHAGHELSCKCYVQSPYFIWKKNQSTENEPQAFDIPGVSEYTEASKMVRNGIFYGEIRSIGKDGNTPDYPHTINFMFTKYSSLTLGSSFI